IQLYEKHRDNSGYSMPASTGFYSKNFDIAFEGICSLRDIEIAVKPLNDKEIKDNMGDLKKKLMEILILYLMLHCKT
ncbi:11102_t:CDS:2, partial [Funneliformis geosporum]